MYLIVGCAPLSGGTLLAESAVADSASVLNVPMKITDKENESQRVFDLEAFKRLDVAANG